MIPLDRALPEGVEGIVHGFTSRRGGVSTGGLASLNLALREHEVPEALSENWRRVLAALRTDLRLQDLAIVEQVHGAEVLEVDGGRGPLDVVGRADALITTVPGVVLAIRTADCVPVLFASPGGVAAAHAGWRGVAAGIVPNTLEALCRRTGDAPQHVRVAVGPHIGPDAYEVGPEVVEGIARSGVPEPVFVRGKNVDLRAAVVHQLVRGGVRAIGHVHRCTFADPDLFSHRRTGVQAGRLAAVIARLG